MKGEKYMQEQGIQQAVLKSELIYPPEEKIKKTTIGSKEAFDSLLAESKKNPEAFWDRIARELKWYKPWEKTMTGSLPDFQFFVGGISNPSINLLDRHIENGAGNRAALIWEGENG